MTLYAASTASLAFQQSRDANGTVPTGTAEIAATLLADDAQGGPIRRANITLTSTSSLRLNAVTDDAGRFGFTSLPAGRYTISASKGGYLSSIYGTKRPGGPGTVIVVDAGQHLTGLTMKLLKSSVITGTVFDENGQPTPDVSVAVSHYAVSSQTGQRTLQGVGLGGQTDDRGVYRIYGLAPGEYVVSATPVMRPNFDSRANGDVHQITSADVQRAQQLLRDPSAVAAPARSQTGVTRTPGTTVGYTAVYYPSVTVPADATLITLGPHEERSNIDVQLRSVPTSRVDGVVLGPDGAAMPGTSLTIAGVDYRSTSADRQGKFSFQGVRPGRYTIVARATSAPTSQPGGATQGPAPMLWASADVTVDGQDIGTSLTLAPGMTVSGRLVFEGALARPADMTMLRPSLSPVQGAPGMSVMSPFARMEPNGTFTFTGVMPGLYRLSVSVPGSTATAGWSIKSSVVKGVDTYDMPVEIAQNENVEDAVITLTDRRAEISGRMQDAAGRPAPEYFILLFSADRKYWVPQSRRTQAIRPAADGAFAARNLPPGDYLIVALTDVEDGQWNDPAFLAELAASGPIRITLADGEKKIQDLRVGGG